MSVAKFQTTNGWTKERMKEQVRLRNNGNRSLSIVTARCAYKTPEGNHCAAGCFIPDGHPAEQSIKNISYILEQYPDLAESMPLDKNGMYYFQQVHDHCFDGSIDMRERLCQWIDNNVEDSK